MPAQLEKLYIIVHCTIREIKKKTAAKCVFYSSWCHFMNKRIKLINFQQVNKNTFGKQNSREISNLEGIKHSRKPVMKTLMAQERGS